GHRHEGEAHIADALKKGAKVVTGGKRAAQGGSFFEPTVLTDVTTDMVITKEETFGPVAPLYRFKTEADPIKMANNTCVVQPDSWVTRSIGSPECLYHSWPLPTGRQSLLQPTRALEDQPSPGHPSAPTRVGSGQSVAPAVRH